MCNFKLSRAIHFHTKVITQLCNLLGGITCDVVSLLLPVDAVEPGRRACAVDVEVHDLSVLEQRLPRHSHVADWRLWENLEKKNVIKIVKLRSCYRSNDCLSQVSLSSKPKTPGILALLHMLVSALSSKLQWTHFNYIFGYDRSSRNANLCPSVHSFVRLVQTCLKQSIFIFLGKRAIRKQPKGNWAVREQSEH